MSEKEIKELIPKLLTLEKLRDNDVEFEKLCKSNFEEQKELMAKMLKIKKKLTKTTNKAEIINLNKQGEELKNKGMKVGQILLATIEDGKRNDAKKLGVDYKLYKKAYFRCHTSDDEIDNESLPNYMKEVTDLTEKNKC